MISQGDAQKECFVCFLQWKVFPCEQQQQQNGEGGRQGGKEGGGGGGGLSGARRWTAVFQVNN